MIFVEHLIPFMPLLALLTLAAAWDLRWRRIPNWLTLPLLLAGLVRSFTPFATITPGQALLGMLAGFALPFVLFALGAMGGGDVKLMAAVGAWVGAVAAVWIFAWAAIAGGVLILAQSLWQRRTLALLRNTGVLAVNLANVRTLGVEHVKATGQSTRSVRNTLPYGVPIWIAAVAILAR